VWLANDEISAKEKAGNTRSSAGENKHPGFGHDDLNRGLVWGKIGAK
jgi:hypothetical protein